MSAMDDRLDILMGKSLDGEITPAEQQWFDEELQRNALARERFEQMKMLNEWSRQAVKAEILERGERLEDILDRAWQRYKGTPRRRLVGADGHSRFAAGLVAGFVVGLILHFVLVTGRMDRAKPPGQPSVAADAGSMDAANSPVGQGVPVSYPRPVMRSLDWYSFTDRHGRQWLVEGIREGVVQPAVYRGDL